MGILKIKIDDSNITRNDYSDKLSAIKVFEYKGEPVFYLPLLKKMVLVDKKTEKSINNRENDELLKDFFIKDSLPKDSPPNNTISIFSTLDCNLNCVYCCTGKKYKKEIELEFVEKYIDHVIEKEKLTEITLSFYGAGEPTLALEKIKKIVNYVNQKGIKFNVYIQSNGVFSKKKRNWILKNVDNFNISCDGFPEIQDRNRPLKNSGKTSKIVEDNIKFFLENGKNIFLKSVITPLSVTKMPEIVEYFKRLGAKNIGFTPIDDFGFARNHISTDIDQFIDYYFKAFELATFHGINVGTAILTFNYGHHACNINQYVINPSNEIIFCPYIKLKIGEYNKKNEKFIEYEDNKKILEDRIVDPIKECQNCFLKWHCSGGCMAYSLLDNNDIMKPSKRFCENRKKVSLKYFHYLIEKKMEMKPFIKIKNKKMSLEMIFNKFKLEKTDPNQKFSKNPYIKIDQDFKIETLVKKIVEYRNSFGYKPIMFMIDFEILPNNSRFYKKVQSLIDKLKENKILFLVVKPFPYCSSCGNKDKIPYSCKDCLELFTINEKDEIIFCNGKKSKFKETNFVTRDQIFEEFKSLENKNEVPQTCKSCIYLNRGKCDIVCQN